MTLCPQRLRIQLPAPRVLPRWLPMESGLFVKFSPAAGCGESPPGTESFTAEPSGEQIWAARTCWVGRRRGPAGPRIKRADELQRTARTVRACRGRGSAPARFRSSDPALLPRLPCAQPGCARGSSPEDRSFWTRFRRLGTFRAAFRLPLARPHGLFRNQVEMRVRFARSPALWKQNCAIPRDRSIPRNFQPRDLRVGSSCCGTRVFSSGDYSFQGATLPLHISSLA